MQEIASGSSAPVYLIRFDKDGRCESPGTLAHLLHAVRGGGHSRVVLFSHGWNNDWSTATQRYDHFIGGYARMHQEHTAEQTAGGPPLLVGVIWPSTALVAPWEAAPGIAAGGAAAGPNSQVPPWIWLLAEDVEPGARDDFVALAQRDALSGSELEKLTNLLLPVFRRYRDAAGGQDLDYTAEELRKLAEALSAEGRKVSRAFGLRRTTEQAPRDAGLSEMLAALDPRHLIRLATVVQMKDRAGRVGALGVGDLLRDLLAVADLPVHLVGHSYGAIVVMSALCAADTLPRKVESVLLLQPAVSRLCFAENADGRGYPGGYRRAFPRVRQPIMTTFSVHDVPLTRFFHLALRRMRDLGQPHAAAAREISCYAALGGFGPGGCAPGEAEVVTIRNPGEPYPPAGQGVRVVALNSDGAIKGHGEISNPATWWALLNQVAHHGRPA